MSFVVAVPELVAATASDAAIIGSALRAANATAAASTTGLLAAAADEVSAAVASLFSAHALSYQQVAGQAAAFHDQFVQALTGAGASYALTEVANVQQNLLNAVNAPVQALFGRPLIGDGAAGTATNPSGQDGGLLYGNGGAGYNSSATPGMAGGNGGNAGLIGTGGAGGA
ncbi:PE family protein, partial [Mycobacterium persicum]